MSTSWSRKFPRAANETAAVSSETAARADTQSHAPEPSPYLAGEVIGDRYRLVRELGRGGMGVVWVGHALALGVEVAVKLIRASAAGPAVASRMAREAHAAARLGHPALVRVFDFGWTSRGDPYLVMELVQGETLSAAIAREGRISAIRAVQMLLPVADGLRLAHDRTIVHRDIKPDNIFLATDPLGRVQPKLLDFGIAKVGPANHDGRLTQIGVVLGSPEYMSPEQALGIDDVDERTDVWSLSVVLYEMVTGIVPHRKPNYNALMQAIIHEEPLSMIDHAAGDASLWQVVARGLAKDRDQRWASMAELGEALALWLYEHGIKEDICGNSIRAVWLDGAASGVKLPEVATLAPASQARAVSPPRYSRTADTQPRRHLTSAFLRHYLASGQRRPIAIAAATLGAIAGGFMVAALLRERPSPETNLPPSAGLVASQPIPAGVGAPRAIESPVASSQADTTPVQPSQSEPSARPTAAATAPRDAASRPKSKTSASGNNATKANPKPPKKRHDFGF